LWSVPNAQDRLLLKRWGDHKCAKSDGTTVIADGYMGLFRPVCATVLTFLRFSVCLEIGVGTDWNMFPAGFVSARLSESG